MSDRDAPHVLAISAAPVHRFSKANRLSIRLLAGLGVEGDAHCGPTVRHRYDVRRDPTRPNRRQIHLIPAELFDDFAARGFAPVNPGELGENVTTRGLDLLALPTGTRLTLGSGGAVIELTGLRQPCVLIDRFRNGLMAACVDRDAAGKPIYKAGVMAIVLSGGDVRRGDAIGIERPAGAHRPLACV